MSCAHGDTLCTRCDAALAAHDAAVLREWQPCPRCHEAVRGWPQGACPACGAKALLPEEIAEHDAQVKADAKAEALREAEAVCKDRAHQWQQKPLVPSADAWKDAWRNGRMNEAECCADAIAALAGKGAGR